MKAAMVEIFRKLPQRAQLVACVHDEVLCESCIDVAEEVLGLVVGEMQDAAIAVVGTAVTMKAEGGVVQSWGEK
jgi:DNA polymerase I-like protein with 3'-5' exonuclease and polymerase domains